MIRLNKKHSEMLRCLRYNLLDNFCDKGHKKYLKGKLLEYNLEHTLDNFKMNCYKKHNSVNSTHKAKENLLLEIKELFGGIHL
jgi:hypothetical protein